MEVRRLTGDAARSAGADNSAEMLLEPLIAFARAPLQRRAVGDLDDAATARNQPFLLQCLHRHSERRPADQSDRAGKSRRLAAADDSADRAPETDKCNLDAAPAGEFDRHRDHRRADWE